MVKLIAIVALEQNNGIGLRNRLPWGRIKTDMDHFRKLTQDSTVVMGRKTWTSLPCTASGIRLPGRDCVVMTRDDTWDSPQATPATSVADVISHCTNRNIDTAFVIGGAEVYRAFHKQLDAMHLTRLHGSWDCDTFFPMPEGMRMRVAQNNVTDERTGTRMNFEYWER